MKKTQHRNGSLIYSHIKIDAADKSDEALTALTEMLDNCTPRSRVKRWKSLADQVEAGQAHIAEAEKLIDSNGHVKLIDRFDLHMARAEAQIQAANTDRVFIPKVKAAVKHSEDQSKRAKGNKSPITSIIEKLLYYHSNLTVPELWPHFVSAIEKTFEQCEEVVGNKHRPDTWLIKYKTEQKNKKTMKNKTYKFSSFESRVSLIKKKKVITSGV